MRKQIIFLLTCAFITQHCIAMEEQSSEEPLIFQPITNRLLTIITAKTITTDHFRDYCKWEKSRSTTTTDTLANLMRDKYSTTGHEYSDGRTYTPYKRYILFCPIIIQQTSYTFKDRIYYEFRDHGKFDKKQHKEVKEAMRQNQAVYFMEGPGTIVYDLNQQPDPEKWADDEFENFLKILKQYNQDI